MKNQFYKEALILILSVVFLSGCSQKGKITLVKSGDTKYSILIDPSAPQSVITASEDLINYFTKVTGATPKKLVSEQVPATPFISLGNTSALKASGLDTVRIPNEGFRMVTKNGNLFIYGPDTPTEKVNIKNLDGISSGTANGIYSFIENYLGVHLILTGEAGEYYSKKSTITIPASDQTESTPFNYRDMGRSSQRSVIRQWNDRMKLSASTSVSYMHGWDQAIPAASFSKHPEWFAEIDGKPLPPSSRRAKLETTNPGLIQEYARVIIETFRANPDLNWYSLSPPDGREGYSNSPASLALTEKDPFGAVSHTPLILKFYNDVARIVGKEFPDHKLGGLIYMNYLYPPASGISKLEPNLALVVAPNFAYGFQLYRRSAQENWEKVLGFWGEAAKKNGIDIYYFDTPVWLAQPNGMIWPPSPELLNFIFSRLKKYGYKGGKINGNPDFPVFGAINYTIAKMLWNPDQDAAKILNNYYQMAFGTEAAPYIKKLYNVLDTAFNKFYNSHTSANWTASSDHLIEIYAPNYQEMEQYYLKAREVKKDPEQQERIDLFGKTLSLMQWNLRSNGLLPDEYKSPLTLSDEQIDQILSDQDDESKIVTTQMSFLPPRILLSKVEKMNALPDAKTRKAVIVPVSGSMRMLLYVPVSGEVTINVKAFGATYPEFVHYILSTADGKQMQRGAVREGRHFRFNGEAGKSYFLEIPSALSGGGAFINLEVSGAAIAYRSNLLDNSFLVAGKPYMESDLPLYFYVPEELKSFSITFAVGPASVDKGAMADLYSPDGKLVSQMNCSNTGVSHLVIKGSNFSTGFWKIIIHKYSDTRVRLTLDPQLPQWLIPDPAQPLIVVTK